MTTSAATIDDASTEVHSKALMMP
ncbi:hypothetical protein AVEN_29646-1, partial [Araneus ventricosus]